MSKNYEDYKPINPMPPRRRRNPMLSFVQYSIIFLLSAALVVSAVYFVALHNGRDDKGADDEVGKIPSVEPIPEETLPPEQTEEETDVDEPVVEPIKPGINLEDYITVDIPRAQMNKGSLILVSKNYKAVYPEAGELVDLVKRKSNSYQLSINTIKVRSEIVDSFNLMMDDFFEATGKTDVTVWTGYRDEARQTQVYNEYVAQHGQANSEKYVSKPGESDHHTALGVVLKAFSRGAAYNLDELDGYSWLEENCSKYGFVERYPEDKVDVTGIDYSASFYLRYVGKPHAEFMAKNGICLEEYIITLKDYTFGNAHYEYTTEDGTSYEIYYVRAEGEGENVSVNVPKDKEYTVSGNNMDGFIVTVKK